MTGRPARREKKPNHHKDTGMYAGYITSEKMVEQDADNHQIDEDAHDWIVCPECGSEEAGYQFWGEGVDMNFRCPDCGNGYGVR